MEPGLDPGLIRKLLRLPADRREQAQFLEHSRREPRDNPPQSFNRSVQHLERLLDLCLLLLGFSFTRQHLQMEAQNHEGLTGFVVQLAADSPPFLLLTFEELPRYFR
jgi:hypothetical protein